MCGAGAMILSLRVRPPFLVDRSTEVITRRFLAPGYSYGWYSDSELWLLDDPAEGYADDLFKAYDLRTRTTRPVAGLNRIMKDHGLTDRENWALSPDRQWILITHRSGGLLARPDCSTVRDVHATAYHGDAKWLGDNGHWVSTFMGTNGHLLTYFDVTVFGPEDPPNEDKVGHDLTNFGS